MLGQFGTELHQSRGLLVASDSCLAAKRSIKGSDALPHADEDCDHRERHHCERRHDDGDDQNGALTPDAEPVVAECRRAQIVAARRRFADDADADEPCEPAIFGSAQVGEWLQSVLRGMLKRSGEIKTAIIPGL